MGRPNSSDSPVVSPYCANARTAPEPRPCISSFMPACATTSLPSSSHRWLTSLSRKERAFVAEGLPLLLRQEIKLLQCLSKAMRDLHVLARQFAHELHIVVAGD